MIRLDEALQNALQDSTTDCPIPFLAPFEYVRNDQLHDVPDRLRGLIALTYKLMSEPDFGVSGSRFDEFCALRTLTEGSARDALFLPLGTNLEFFANWKMLAVRPEDQCR